MGQQSNVSRIYERKEECRRVSGPNHLTPKRRPASTERDPRPRWPTPRSFHTGLRCSLPGQVSPGLAGPRLSDTGRPEIPYRNNTERADLKHANSVVSPVNDRPDRRATLGQMLNCLRNTSPAHRQNGETPGRKTSPINLWVPDLGDRKGNATAECTKSAGVDSRYVYCRRDWLPRG